MRSLVLLVVVLVGCSRTLPEVETPEQQEFQQLLTSQQQREQVDTTLGRIRHSIENEGFKTADVRQHYPEFYRMAAIVGYNIIEIEEEFAALEKRANQVREANEYLTKTRQESERIALGLRQQAREVRDATPPLIDP